MTPLNVWYDLMEHISECKRITSYDSYGKREYIGYNKDHFCYEINVEIIEKELKALEIIKEKKVDVGYFIEYIEWEPELDYDGYLELTSGDDGYAIITFCRTDNILSKEEYDLLKEVLCYHE